MCHCDNASVWEHMGLLHSLGLGHSSLFADGSSLDHSCI